MMSEDRVRLMCFNFSSKLGIRDVKYSYGGHNGGMVDVLASKHRGSVPKLANAKN